MRHQSRSDRRNGFTLIELLVVVAIIVVLMAILLPSLGTARNAAVSAKCQSNLRQIGIAVQMYTSDYSGYMPCPTFAYTQTFTFPNNWPYGWPYTPGMLNTTLPYLQFTQSQYIVGFSAPSRSALTQRPATACPAFYPNIAAVAWGTGLTGSTGDFAYKRGGTYVFNSHLDRSLFILTGGTSPAVQGYMRKLTAIERPQMRFIYGESDTNLQGDPICTSERASNTLPALWYGHSNKTNMLFVDGHVESLLKTQIPKVLDQPNRAPYAPHAWGTDTPIPNIW